MSKKKRYIAEDQLDIDKKLQEEKDDRIASQKAVKLFVGDKIAEKTNQTLKTDSDVAFKSINTSSTSRLAGHFFGTNKIEIGSESRGTGDRNAYIDFHSGDSYINDSGDYHARIIRGQGVNGYFNIEQQGNGNLGIAKHGSSATGELSIDNYARGNLRIEQHNSNGSIWMNSKNDIHIVNTSDDNDGGNAGNKEIHLLGTKDGGGVKINTWQHDRDLVVYSKMDHSNSNHPGQARYLHYRGSDGVLYINSGNISKYNSNWANHVYFRVQGAISVRRIYDATIDEAHNNIRGLKPYCFHSDALNSNDNGDLGDTHDSIPTSKTVKDYVNKNSGRRVVRFCTNDGDADFYGRPYMNDSRTTYSYGVIDNMGDGYLWGHGANGRLGTWLSSNNWLFNKIRLPTTATIKQICCSGIDTLVLDSHGKVWHTGENAGGLRGDGTNKRGDQIGEVWKRINFPNVYYNGQWYAPVIDKVYLPNSTHKTTHANDFAFFITTAKTGNFVFFLGGDGHGTLSNSPNGIRRDSPYLIRLGNGTPFRAKHLSCSYVQSAYVFYAGVIAIGVDGKPYTWGHNFEGNLGRTTTNETMRYPSIPSGIWSNVTEVMQLFQDNGANSWVFYNYMRIGNRIWVAGGGVNGGRYEAMGINRSGNNSTNVNYSTFREIGFSSTVKNALGTFKYMTRDCNANINEGSTVFVMGSKGRVAVWGTNGYGQAGVNNYSHLATPHLNVVTSVKKVIPLAHASLYLKTNNELWGVGINRHNGQGTTNDSRNSTVRRIAINVKDVFISQYGQNTGHVAAFIVYNDGSCAMFGHRNGYESLQGWGGTNRAYSPSTWSINMHMQC